MASVIIDRDRASSSFRGDIGDFDQYSGSRIERLMFNNRPLLVAFAALLTLVFGFFSTKLAFNASHMLSALALIPALSVFLVGDTLKRSEMVS